MSVSSILAFVLAGATARAKSVQVARPSEKRRIAELEAKVAELEDAIADANAQARRDQELIDMWRDRALYATPWAQQAAQMQAAALQQQSAAQYNAQQAMNAQNYYQAMGLLGAQQLSPLEWCNCVPARHDMFLRGE